MKKIIAVFVLFIVGIQTPGGYTQEEVEMASVDSGNIQEVTPGLEGTISLDLKEIDIVEALKFLAIKAKINVVTTKQVAGRVTLKVEKTSIQDVFDVMLRANGLAYDVRDTIYNVMTDEEYRNLYGESFSDVREVKIFHLDYAIPEQIFNLCDTLKSDVGRILVSQESGTVLVMDSPEKIKAVGEAIDGFEQKNVVKVFNINYAHAKDIAEQLRTQLEAKKVGYVRADERTNQIIVQTLPERMKQIEELIYTLDRKTREVLIDAKIIKVDISEMKTEAVEWEGLFEVIREKGLTYVGSYPFSAVQASDDPWRSRRTVLEGGWVWDGDANTEVLGVDYVGSYPFTGTASNFAAGRQSIGLQQMHLGIVGKQDFDIILSWFKDVGETQVISSPKITVTNNQEAKIHVGAKEGYVTTTTTTTTAGPSTVAEDVSFIDVGTLLNVTPSINEQGYVTLKVKIEVSTVVRFLKTTTGNEIPILGTSVAETTVMSQSGSTVVIGGLRGDDKTFKTIKTPILGDVPFLGKFFTSHVPKKGRSELLVMITPTVVSGDRLSDYSGKAIGKKPFKLDQKYQQPIKAEKVSPSSPHGKSVIKGLK
ncbi:MAG: hypothetical protein JSW40_10205 [Candidatus Omnitrophota bacterium]|nr:MAG: hypothetical protein JSW40_10205 [Candidatus Omnitrophota bacterium]